MTEVKSVAVRPTDDEPDWFDHFVERELIWYDEQTWWRNACQQLVDELIAEKSFAKIPGFSRYSVDILGNVRRDDTGKMMKHSPTHYPMVSLTNDNNKGKKVFVHRMVALVHVPNPDNKPFVNHIDGNIKNCSAANLCWVTSSENTKHACATGLRGGPIRGRGVQCISPTTNELVAEYQSISEAKRAIGSKSRQLAKCLDTATTYKGFLWKQINQQLIEGEEWQDIVSCDHTTFPPGRYSISNQGRVRINRNSNISNGYLNTTGYLFVTLHTDEKKDKGFLVHRLVATAFVECPDNTRKYDIDHINGVKTDNRAANLQWLTRAEHAVKTTGREIAQVDGAGRVVAIHRTLKEAAKSIGVTEGVIVRVFKGTSTQSGGYRWMYATDEIKRSLVDIPVEEHKRITRGSFVQKRTDGAIIATFADTKSAAKAVNGKANGILGASKGVSKTYKGFILGADSAI
ncbi:MAG: HNH endonuclease [Patescibacteria group bacterium]|nr:HNH endonuclease [Patescibacteria group bacterium]